MRRSDMLAEPLYIVGLTFEGVKAFDRVLKLDRMDLLTGDVGAGKSSIIDAIVFAALGLIPRLGKREADTARIMRGSRMVVRVELSDARWFTRSLGREGGAFRSEARCSWIPSNATNTAHAGAIRGLFGASDEEAAEHLDLRELLAATPAQRATRIEALLAATAMRPEDAASWTEALAVARLAKLDESRIPDDAAKRSAMIDGLVPTLDKGIEPVLQVVLADLEGELKARGIPGALERANAKKREATQAVSKKSNARAEIEDRADDASVPADSLADLDRNRQAATDRIATVRAQLKSYGDAKTARDEAEMAVVNARGKVADHDQVLASIEQARADGARWKAEAAGIVDPPEVPAPRLVEVNPKVNAAADALDADAKVLDGRAAEIEAVEHPKEPLLFSVPNTEGKAESLAIRRGALALAKADPWTAVARIAEGLRTQSRIGPLMAIMADWAEELTTLARTHGHDVAQIESDVADAVAALSQVEKEAAAAGDANEARLAEHAATVRAWDAERDRAKALRGDAAGKRERASAKRTAELARVAELNAGTREKHATDLAARKALVDTAKATRERLNRQADDALADADADEKAITAETAALAEASARLEGVAAAQPIDVAGAEAEIVELGATVESIDVQKRAVSGADARKRELEAIAAEIAVAQAEAATWTAAEWALQRLRERDLAGRGGPLVDRMRTFLRAAGRSEEPYLRATKTATDFGWRRGGEELSVQALSGGESVIFNAALASAVIALRAPEVPLLLIEAAELGEAEPVKATIAGLSAVGGDFANVIAATCFRLKKRTGWTMFRMAGPLPMEVFTEDPV